jgi:cell surface protein SprA
MGNIDLNDPSNINDDVYYDPVTGQYILQSTVGSNIDYRRPMSMSLEEYLNYDMQQAMETYWTERTGGRDERQRPIGCHAINVRGEAFDRIFGATRSTSATGIAEVTFRR